MSLNAADKIVNSDDETHHHSSLVAMEDESGNNTTNKGYLQHLLTNIRVKIVAFVAWLKFLVFDRRSRWEFITVATLYASYASLMACRASLDVALPAMLDDKKHLGKGFNKGTASMMLGT